MLLLTSTSDVVNVLTSAAGAIAVHASWVDNNAGTITPGRTNTASITGISTTPVVGSPLTGIQRNVKLITISNTHASVTNSITVQHTDGANAEELFAVTLLPGENAIMDQAGDWTYFNASGVPYVGNVTGRMLRETVVTSGTAYITGASTTAVKFRLWGGGGAGGGCTSVASAMAAAGGGGAGAYTEWFVTSGIAPSSTYVCAIGAAGTTSSGGAGGNGGATTIAIGTSTATAPGGTGGPVATAVTTLVAYMGGAGGTAGAGGTVNTPGQPGGYGVSLIVASTIGVSGNGGSTLVGAGGLGLKAAGAGNAATGFGGGGGGSMTGTSAARAGGAGTAGLIIGEEFS